MAVVNMDKRANLNRNGTIVLHFKTSQGNIPTLAIIIHLKGEKEKRNKKKERTNDEKHGHLSPGQTTEYRNKERPYFGDDPE